MISDTVFTCIFVTPIMLLVALFIILIAASIITDIKIRIKHKKITNRAIKRWKYSKGDRENEENKCN